MMKRFILVIAAFFLALTPVSSFAQKQADDPVVNFESDDQIMNREIERARAGLPRFWQALAAGGGNEFGIKVAFPTNDGGHEHIWLRQIQRRGDTITGVVDNVPHAVPSIRLGQRVPVLEEDISDWSIMTPNGVYGHYTTRVVFASMPAEERAEYAAFIAEFRDGFPE